MSKPHEHIERLRPPWRTARLTECGRDIKEFAVVLSRDEAIAKLKKEGVQRAAYSLCMTCLSAFERNYQMNWEDDPSAVVFRDANYTRQNLLTEELRALAILWSNHKDEYTSIVEGLAQTIDLSKKRMGRRL